MASLRVIVDAAYVLVGQHRASMPPFDARNVSHPRYADLPMNRCARCSGSWNVHGASVRRRSPPSQPWQSGGNGINQYKSEQRCSGFIPWWAGVLRLDFSRPRLIAPTGLTTGYLARQRRKPLPKGVP